MISIVIPALNEAENLPGLLSRLAREPETHEVVVVDGGSSSDNTAAARAFGVTVVRAEQGRGIQLAAGAARAKGEILVGAVPDNAVKCYEGWHEEESIK